MRRGQVLQGFSRRAPTIVIVSLCVALLAYWTEAPLWLPHGLAIALVVLALILMATRNHAPIGTTKDGGDTNWLTNELAGNGSPSGTYPLGFFAIVMLALTGFEGAYALPAWAALALIAAWAVANAHYPPADDA